MSLRLQRRRRRSTSRRASMPAACFVSAVRIGADPTAAAEMRLHH